MTRLHEIVTLARFDNSQNIKTTWRTFLRHAVD